MSDNTDSKQDEPLQPEGEQGCGCICHSLIKSCQRCGGKPCRANNGHQQHQRERDDLANAIAQAAIKAGIINGEQSLTGPQLVMLCDDLAITATSDTPAVARECAIEIAYFKSGSADPMEDVEPILEIITRHLAGTATPEIPVGGEHVDFVFDNTPCCKVCGLVRPAEGWTRPCKGPHELSLRGPVVAIGDDEGEK